MNHKWNLLLIIGSIAFIACNKLISQQDPPDTEITPYELPPSWAQEAIWYEIGVERFCNGDPSNDPTAEDIQGAYPGFVPEGWTVTPWTQDWYQEDPYMANLEDYRDSYGNQLTKFVDKVQMRRYGGDLQGVLDKVGYLDSLGVTAIYFRPLNDGPSLHKYDARNWRHIDRNFGPDPEGDKQIIASEIPHDPQTWKLTAADKLFLQVIDAFHKRGIRVILDYSWNHTGNTFWAWEDVLVKQEKSEFKDWYWIDQFDDPETPENEFAYHGWVGVKELPEIKETQKQDMSKGLSLFEGNLYSEVVKQHIFHIVHRWLDPNGDGDPSDGVDGYRLDVAAETPQGFWRDFRKQVRSINPDAYLLGEIWWEEWPDKLLSPEPYLRGDVFDAVMNYRWYRAARHFLNASPTSISVSEYIDSLHSFQAPLRAESRYAMMNLNGGFDTPRVLTSLFNKNKYKYYCKVHEDPNYKIHKPDKQTFETLKLLLAHQYTYIGAPHIYFGEEMGMWGADDPSCRKPLIWPELTFDSESAHPLGKERPVDSVKFNHELFDYYQTLIRIRRENPVLMKGDLEFIQLKVPEVLAYRRFDPNEEIYVVINASASSNPISIPSQNRAIYADILEGHVVKREGDHLLVELPARSAAIIVR